MAASWTSSLRSSFCSALRNMRSMLSTTSIMRSTSRAASAKAMLGVPSVAALMYCGRPGSSAMAEAGISRTHSRARGSSRPMKMTASATLNRVWKSATWRAGLASRAAIACASHGSSGSATRQPNPRMIRLPTARRLASMLLPALTYCGMTLPRLAPSTSASAATGATMPWDASAITSSTTAMLE